MKRTLLVVALLLTAAGAVMATGAFPIDGQTDEFDPANESGVVLAPADSPNGDRYAEFNDAGELNITLDAVAGTTTRIDDVFVLGFEGRPGSTAPADIQIDYESEALTILRMDTGRPIGSEPIRFEPNESITLGFEVEADSDTPESFVETVTYRATFPDAAELDFDTGPSETRIITRLDPSELNETDDPSLTDPPRAIINRTTGDGPAFANEMNATDVRAKSAAEVIQVGETVSVSGERSLVDTSYAVDDDRRLVALFDIPTNGIESDRAATIDFPPLAVDALNGTDPSRVTVARRTGGDWQTLPTSVANREDGEVVFQTRTPGFSVFGVFAEPRTTYTWETDDGRTTESRTANFRFEEPGLHRINLTVTDAFGQSNTSTYRVLVNDRPSVDIVPQDIPPNETVRLRADVTNEVGNETITWRFADGSSATGAEVERRFERGEVVNVTVEDEFGATGTEEVVVGETTTQALNVFQWQLGFGGRVLVVVVVAVLILAGLWWLIARRYYREERTRDRSRA